MTKYKDLVGTSVVNFAGNNPGAVEGQLWYDSTNKDFKYLYKSEKASKESDEDSDDEINFLKVQMESANERIQRLQTEMINVQATVDTLTDKRKIIIRGKNESK